MPTPKPTGPPRRTDDEGLWALAVFIVLTTVAAVVFLDAAGQL